MKRVVILGNFDGVHIGHQNLIKEAIKYANSHNLESVVYTFSTLPSNKKYLMTVDEKISAIKDLGVDRVYVEDFFDVKNYTPQEFVKEILKGKLNAIKVFCGYNYTFGNNKSGNVNLLSELIDTTVINEIKVDGIRTSSSTIREYIENGNLELANKLLGKPFQICGEVIHGKKLGRVLGFPTANIRPNALKINIPLGVYGVKLKIEGYDKIYTAIMNIGRTPTITNNNQVISETNILDFNEDIYGKKITVYLYKMIREEKKFENIEKLKEQMTKDKQYWRSIANAYN